MDFQVKLLKLLRRHLDDVCVKNFVEKGDDAKFVADTQLTPEDLVYLWSDLTKAFDLATPRGRRVPSFWRFSLFGSKAPHSEIRDFSVAELRDMVASGRWSASVFVDF